MQINLIAVGKRMPSWVSAGYQEYAKRLPPACALHLVEIEPAKRTKNSVVDQVMIEEGNRIIEAIPKNNVVIALDVKGKAWDTHTLSQQIYMWQLSGQDVSLLVGGPDGLAETCLKRAQQSWSLSSLTFPHPLVRIIIAEQLYRAYSLLKGHPYHRE